MGGGAVYIVCGTVTLMTVAWGGLGYGSGEPGTAGLGSVGSGELAVGLTWWGYCRTRIYMVGP